MKSLTSKTFLTLALLVGASVASFAGDQEVRRIPQGRGQYIEVWTGRAAKPTNALFKQGSSHYKIDAVDTADGKLHPVAVPNAHGSSVTLFRR